MSVNVKKKLMPNEQDIFHFIGDVLNFVFDNADINVRTLTGHDTWHTLGGIVAGTPGGGSGVEPSILRSTSVRSPAEIGQFSQIPIQKYKKQSGAALKKVFISPLKPPNSLPPTLQLAESLDIVWLASFQSFYHSL